ncbi:MAG: efflux RND transporter periplasmic adaptor subunit [Gammaproteobacteria bacterium]|nr:efflux RND transporter periplasmic adaptor subunit [Gammaproteobacteria bacterium]MDP2348799.1 efflux RND transporter periplasmic adaptor subunit [Gammaproteobacteria bacterium]
MRKIIVPFMVIAGAALITALLVLARPGPEVRPPEERVVQVLTVPARSQDMVFTVSSQGTVAPRTQTTLVTEVSGLVLSVSEKFVVGGFFEEGEVLLTLDDADYRVSVQQSRANLLTAQSQLVQESAQAEQATRQWESAGRNRADAPPLALRTPYLEEARARVLFAEADLARAERQLERTRIRAPYDGLIREKMVDVGQFIGTGTQVARTFAVDFAEIRLPLTDRDIAYLELPRPGVVVRAGNSAGAAGSDVNALHRSTNTWGNVGASRGTPVTLKATVGGRPHEWQGAIVRTEGVIDSNTRVYYAIAQVEDPYGLNQADNHSVLSIGSFVNATLQGITARNVFTVPHTAVRNGDEIMVMDSEQRLRQRKVSILRSDADNIYIDGGLSDGEQIIVSPVPVPIDGMRVTPATGSPVAPAAITGASQ